MLLTDILLELKCKRPLDHSMWFHDDFNFDTIEQTNSSEEDTLSKPIRRSPDIPPIPSKGTCPC